MRLDNFGHPLGEQGDNMVVELWEQTGVITLDYLIYQLQGWTCNLFNDPLCICENVSCLSMQQCFDDMGEELLVAQSFTISRNLSIPKVNRKSDLTIYHPFLI